MSNISGDGLFKEKKGDYWNVYTIYCAIYIALLV